MRRVVARLVISCTWLLCQTAPVQAAPSSAGASEPPPGVPRLTFGWHAPPSCPSREVVLSRAERLLGQPLESSLKAPLTIEATASELGAEGWELRLASGDVGAEPRLVRAASCEELAEMAALFTALSIDPTLRVESTATFADMREPAKVESDAKSGAPGSGEPGPAPAAAPTPPPERPPAPPTTPPPAAAPRAPLHVRPLAAAAIALGLGRLPGVALGVSAEGGVALDRLSFRGMLGYYPARHAAVTATTGGDLSLGTAGVRSMYALALGTPTLALSAGVALGWLHGTGTGVANRDSGDALLLAFEPGARAGYPLSRSLALVADAALTLPFNRPRFVLEGLGQVYQPEMLGARFGLGAEWSLP